MILKIRSITPDIKWHYIDYIHRMTVSEKMSMPLSQFKKRVYRVQDVFYVSPRLEFEADGAELRPVDNNVEGTQSFHFFEAYCVDVDGDEFTVVFDGDGFLMNDAGKTIDKFILYDNP